MTALITRLCCCGGQGPPYQIPCEEFLKLCYPPGYEIKLKFASTKTFERRDICADGSIGGVIEQYSQSAKARITGVYQSGNSTPISVKASVSQRQVDSFQTQGYPCQVWTPCLTREVEIEFQGEGLLGCNVNPRCESLYATIPISPFARPITIYATMANTFASIRTEYSSACCLPGQQCNWFETAAPGLVGGLFEACFLPGCNYIQRCPIFTATLSSSPVPGIFSLPGAGFSACTYSSAYFDPAGGGFISETQTGMVGTF